MIKDKIIKLITKRVGFKHVQFFINDKYEHINVYKLTDDKTLLKIMNFELYCSPTLFMLTNQSLNEFIYHEPYSDVLYLKLCEYFKTLIRISKIKEVNEES